VIGELLLLLFRYYYMTSSSSSGRRYSPCRALAFLTTCLQKKKSEAVIKYP
jgi:hypothetical protein